MNHNDYIIIRPCGCRKVEEEPRLKCMWKCPGRTIDHQQGTISLHIIKFKQIQPKTICQAPNRVSYQDTQVEEEWDKNNLSTIQIGFTLIKLQIHQLPEIQEATQ